MKKYTYYHYIDNKLTTKEHFLKVLSQEFLRCDDNNENELCNISYVDEQALVRKYNALKRTGNTWGVIYDGTGKSHIYRVDKVETKKCCICGAIIEGWGNNPWGALNAKNETIQWDNDARCCDLCDSRYIITGRLYTYMLKHKKGEQ